MTNRNIDMARVIAEKVREAGGTAYYVGGFVRDRLMGLPSEDLDIEIHGLTPDTIASILDNLGGHTSMGKSFGIYGLLHYDIDIALPRLEKARGTGHRDFEVFCDPFLGEEKAARRRDFTVNAMMENILTGEILDFFGGRDDLENGILRRVDPETFPEDPLRVLRCAQFASRFGFKPDEETLSIMTGMDITTLSRERVWGELKKALLQSSEPSVFFEILRETDQLGFWFPETEKLIGVEQNPVYHPEGDVFRHTMAVIDESARLRNKAVQPLAFMTAAWCHDLGKPDASAVSENGVIHAIGHELVGQNIAQEALSRITGETKLIRYVKNMIRLHMRPNMYAAQHSGRKAWMRLWDDAEVPEDLILLAEADAMGQLRSAEDYAGVKQCVLEKYADYKALSEIPQVTGADLAANGIKPGPVYREMLDLGHALWLAGVDRENALRQILNSVPREKRGGKR